MHQQADAPTPAPPSGADSPLRPFVIVLLLAALHAWATWGYTGTFWGDHGRWLHAIQRFVAGEMPYRDFVQPTPPLGLWVTATVARLTGTSFAAISAQMVFWYFVVVALFLVVLRRYTPRLVLPIAIPSLLFAFAYACRSGACVPLPAGSEAPSVLIGFICILGALILLLENVEEPNVARAAGAGALAGLAVLGKHDYWVAAVYIAAIGTVYLATRRQGRALVAATPISFFSVVALGTAMLIAQVGFANVAHVYAGSGRAFDIALRSTPSLERLTAEIAGSAALVLSAVAALWLCLAISDKAASRWAGVMVLVFLTSAAIHLGMSVAIGRDLIAAGSLSTLPTLSQESLWRNMTRGDSLFSAALALFDARLQAHLFPVVLPPVLLAVLLARWRRWHDPVLRWRVGLLLGLCIVARTRHGFAGPDWYNVLFELPAYALFLYLLCGPATIKAGKAVRAEMLVLIVLGLYAYVSLGVGPGTLRGGNPASRTRQGTVRWHPQDVDLYRYADSLLRSVDSSATRPLFAFGGTGGWNYFLARKNPLPYTAGLTLQSPSERDAATALLRRARNPLLLFNARALRPTLAPANAFEWEPHAERSVYAREDLGWFLSVARTCTNVSGDSTATIRIYDCNW